MMIRVALLAVVGGLGGACTAEDPGAATVVITLTYDTNDGVDCFVSHPDPASVLTNQGFQFKNESMVTYTIVGGSETEITGVPFATIAPGATSNPLGFVDAGVYYFYAQSCPPTGNHTNRHVLNVTLG